MRLPSARTRHAAHVVECAFVYPVVLAFTIGVMVMGLGVFRYQEVAYLAREAARYASVHAGQYQQENAAAIAAGSMPNVTDDYITTNVVKANATMLDLDSLNVTINFNSSSGSYDWDDTANNNNRWPYSETTQGGLDYNATNTVSVTVSYTWVPEAYFVGPYTLTSTSVMAVCY